MFSILLNSSLFYIRFSRGGAKTFNMVLNFIVCIKVPSLFLKSRILGLKQNPPAYLQHIAVHTSPLRLHSQLL